LKKTGKSERKANIYGIASNYFRTEVEWDDEYSQDDSDTCDDIAVMFTTGFASMVLQKDRNKQCI